MSREIELASEIISTRDKLISARSNFDSLFQEIGDYVIPRKSNITSVKADGSRQMEYVYDSTAIHALELMAASLNSSLTSQSIRWFSLRPRNTDIANDNDSMKWMEQAAEQIYFEYQISNFGAEFHEAYLDVGGFGTCAVIQEQGKDRLGRFRLIFKTIDIAEYRIQENEHGLADEIFRNLKYTAKQAAAKFGEKNIPDKIRSALQKDPYTLFEFVHAVRPRTMLDVKNELMAYSSVYVSCDDRKIVSEGGYSEFPTAVARWAKTSGEIYGRSPAMKALPDVRTINKAKELELKMWAKKIDPPLLARDDGVIGSIRMTPGGITYVRDSDSITPINIAPSYEVSQIKSQEIRQSIRECFFADQWQLPPFQGTPATATEIERRVEQMNRLLGPTVGRLGTELLEPTILRSFNILLRANKFPEPPDVLKRELLESDRPVEIEYLGPLARAQKSTDVFAIQRWIESLAPLISIRPETADVVNTDKISKINRERLGVPVDAMRGEKDVKNIRAARAQAIEEQNQQAMQAQQAQNARDMAPLIKATGAGGQGEF
jgi:hypothetical protein